ncbi:DUF4272 domain-containing protein [Massilia yuzhufengensis]|uniref:DUF4272 domain-containing protein n=1 Tax=Massilia yuzhufengensis TaxID=1164594 RepID=A0A1I1KRR5_9BURK|nr:DUF4272 domain-containing protein [Massilia yuzhufengensis]SFC60853.1 protein of unknown function [Massilia yuzhufengensis]
MTAEERRAASEALLRDYAIPINPNLPSIDDGDVTLRSEDALWCRLVALWGVVGAAMLRRNDFFKEYFAADERRAMLSDDEAAFLFNDAPPEEDRIRFSWRLEALMFLAWCAGLVEDSGLPVKPSSAEAILPLYPHDLGDAAMLRDAIRLRSKDEILDQADLLYRLHWAVRDAQLNRREPPPGINPGMVLEWHHAVNWMTGYDGEDDWDAVPTDT